MGIKTVDFITCDECEESINPEIEAYIDAMVYDRVFHIKCMEMLDKGIVGMLDIDDIKIKYVNGNSVRYFSHRSE